MTAVVTKNKVVSLIYVLRNEKGEIFEYRDLPVSYVHGSGADLFPRIEQALEGRAVGERVSVQLTPADAFGDRDPKLTFTDDIENAPPELRRVGAEFEAQNARGESIMLTVTHIEGDKITVDANHPLAGQTISFEVTVQDIRDATPEEIRNGRPAGDLPTLQ
ncbi:MAG: FKBP-type peptidyl-prolyl cis-trans isomerase [Gammaproteobacteria bacterium]|nr:FKBP-type peptidyl-prolyl cis-trans isomerase [Gammaproteobacteria bacterium]